ncbi:hypothetical protein C1N53_08240 [Pontibacter sp. SGAir0037]|nr:hypothetical protein C1N53_08240 [Pontibacter sp. SGAir0037]
MNYSYTVRHHTYRFRSLKELLAKASPFRSGDALAGVAAASYEERVAAQIVLADVPLKTFYMMGVPGADDIMLNYQSTSFHDALYVRKVLGLRPAPEFEQWLIGQGIVDEHGKLQPAQRRHQLLKIMG